MASERASDWFATEAEFTDMLEAAEENATDSNEIRFVDSLTRAAQKYGMDTYISEAQYDWLKSIAEK
jgi:hypothetical protein